MRRIPPPDVLRRHIDAAGRLTLWPSKNQKRIAVMEWLTAHFEPDRVYSEKEVNAVLRALHTFEDWALLRRELYDRGYLDRKSDGSAYWVRRRGDRQAGS